MTINEVLPVILYILGSVLMVALIILTIQLIITTHNISLMECIKTNKHSIDFLSSDSILVPWVKNGNYKPSVVYKDGMIPYSPFNIDADDFMRAFYYDEE